MPLQISIMLVDLIKATRYVGGLQEHLRVAPSAMDEP